MFHKTPVQFSPTLLLTECNRWIAGARDVRLDFLCHEVMKRKGFWDGCEQGEPGYEAHVWKQMAHLFIEVDEYFHAENTEKEAEELADILIVLADLMGGMGVPLYSEYVQPFAMCNNLLGAVKDLVDYYRKHGEIHDVELLALCYRIAQHGMLISPLLETAFMNKMVKNLGREHQYGVAQSRS